MISVLLATTGRPDRAEASVLGLIASTEGHDLEIVVAVDADPESVKRLNNLWPPDRVQLIIDNCRHYRGCSTAWNDALGEASGDPVVLAADDLTWNAGWLDAALAKLAEFEDGWGFVGFNDGHHREELSTHYLMSRRFVVDVLGGVIAWPSYGHSFNDVEANERAKRAGRYAWCEDAHVEHAHWLYGTRPQDETDIRALGDYERSKGEYTRREQAGFPSDYDPVITS